MRSLVNKHQTLLILSYLIGFSFWSYVYTFHFLRLGAGGNLYIYGKVGRAGDVRMITTDRTLHVCTGLYLFY